MSCLPFCRVSPTSPGLFSTGRASENRRVFRGCPSDSGERTPSVRVGAVSCPLRLIGCAVMMESASMAYVALALIAAASLGAAIVYGLRARRLAGDAGQRALTAEARVSAQRDEIRRKEALLRGLVETSPAAMVLFTDSGRITFSNAAARALFFEDTDVEGQNFLTMLERAPEPLRRSLLSTGSELFTTEGPDGPETFHLSKQHLEGQTLIAVRNVTREIGRKENAGLKKVIRIIGHEISNSLISSLVGSARLILERPEHLPKLNTVFDTIEERARHLRTFLDEYAKLARLPQPRPVR